MANAAGMLKESIWRDKEFRALPRGAQATYAQLISQKELDRAGMQPLQVSKWAKGCDAITAADIEVDLQALEDHRFVFVDEDTDELFIRSYMRHADVARYPNILKNALRCAGLVASEKIRRELAGELRRLRKADADRVADQIDPDPPNPNETRSNGSETVPQTVREGLNGSGTPREPQGYGSRYGSLTSGVTQVGEPPQKSQHDEATPPDRFCAKHMPDGTDEACPACGTHRERRKRWDAGADQRAADARAAFWTEVRACPDCDEKGFELTGDDRLVRCSNHDWSPSHA